jgi:cytochrome P450
MRHMLWTPGNPPLSPPGEGDGLMGVLGTRFAQRRMRAVKRILSEELEARRDAGATGDDDLLGCLARADPPLGTAAALDELLPVLMAAQEPAAAALTWVLELLAREPEVAARHAGEPPDRAFREAVVREVLRLRPPALAMLRRLTEPTTVDGQELPAGASVVAPIVLLHREAGAFPEPDAFLPGRWLDGGAPEASYRPFGSGARRCLGEALAKAELDVAVPVVLRALRLRPAWPRPERMVLRATILVPHRSGMVVARAR